MEALITPGSNIDRERNMAAAIGRLRAHPQMELIGCQPDLHHTPPSAATAPIWPAHLYQCGGAHANTLPAAELRHELRAMEAALGRRAPPTSLRCAYRPRHHLLWRRGAGTRRTSYPGSRRGALRPHRAAGHRGHSGRLDLPGNRPDARHNCSNAEHRRNGEITMNSNGIYHNGNGSNGRYANGNGHNGNGHNGNGIQWEWSQW